jgi:hypothetical protein
MLAVTARAVAEATAVAISGKILSAGTLSMGAAVVVGEGAASSTFQEAW